MGSYKRLWVAVCSFAGLLCASAEPAGAAPSYNVATGSMSTINEHAVSKNVTNNCALGLFVPTQTAGEWSSFYNAAPSCVTVAAAGCTPSCTSVCGGEGDGCGGTCALNNGAACNDGLWCTVGDTCSGGSCSGNARICNDGLSCTVDWCDESTDTCQHEDIGCGGGGGPRR